MMTGLVFEPTMSNLALFAVGIAYTLSLIKDWRPIRTLRAENRQLRDDLSSAESKIHDLESEVRHLKEASVPSLLDEHKKIAAILDKVVAKLEVLSEQEAVMVDALKANTIAVELLVKGSVIADALKDAAA